MSILIGAILAVAAQGVEGPPEIKALPSKCRCEDAAGEDLSSFVGIVTDAQITLAPDGRSPADRQAAIFRVVKSADGFTGIVKVWHTTDPDSCGVTFDYGRKYTVVVEDKDGELETNYCIDPRRNQQQDD